MNYIEEEVKKYCNEGELLNIHVNWPKIIGIESNLEILNENDKYVGKVLLNYNGGSKLYFNMVVEFNKTKIKWRSTKSSGGFTFVLVDPYWVKPYTQAPKLNIPVNIYNAKSGQHVVQMSELSFQQYRKRRLIELLGKYQYKYVAAYENFQFLLKNNKYYYCINSTVKHYGIPQEDLVKFLSIVDNYKKQINKEWNVYLNNHFNQNQSQRLINELYKKNELEKSSKNVIDFKKTS